jgi:hypothetical protein
MTESEWLNAWDVRSMLAFVGVSDRKLRLFACACVRRVWHLIPAEEYPEWREAVEKAEEYADGLLTLDEMFGHAITSRLKAQMEFRQCRLYNVGAAARAASNWSNFEGRWAGLREQCVGFSAVMATTAAGHAAEAAAYHAALPDWTGQHIGYYDPNGRPDDPAWLAALVLEKKEQADLARDIFGNPFRAPPAINPAWLTWNDGLVQKLAQAAYEERVLPAGHLDPARLAVLADALEDAGCTDADLLEHLRGPRRHVRGCWAIDHLTGKG